MKRLLTAKAVVILITFTAAIAFGERNLLPPVWQVIIAALVLGIGIYFAIRRRRRNRH